MECARLAAAFAQRAGGDEETISMSLLIERQALKNVSPCFQPEVRLLAPNLQIKELHFDPIFVCPSCTQERQSATGYSLDRQVGGKVKKGFPSPKGRDIKHQASSLKNVSPASCRCLKSRAKPSRM